MPPPEGEGGRKRKTHKKSRGGCGNCKLRRCDESRPQCQKCLAYGVSCNYDGGEVDGLQVAGEGAFALPSLAPGPQAPPTPPNEVIFGMLDWPLALHDTDETYRLTSRDLDLLRHFQDRTVFTIGTAATVHIYRDQIPAIGFHRPYLTHIILTMALMHERCSAGEPPAPPSTAESFHGYHGAALYNAKLSQPVEHAEKDALWAACALLGCVAMAAIEERRAEDCWPCRPPAPADLAWLRMSEGKKEIWRLADPLRPDSVWKPALEYEINRRDRVPGTPPGPRLDALFPYLIRVYDVEDSATAAPAPRDDDADADADPFRTSASILVRLLGIRCTHATIMYFLSFLGHMDPEFRRLLHRKEPKALLLLAWWYGKMCDYPVWWLTRRASLECRSICLYLEREHAADTEVMGLLGFPKAMCGLVSP